MRVAVISPVWFAVPPPGYGGIELVVSLLADGLVDAGHDVTLFASGDSHSKAPIEYVFEIAPSAAIGTTEVEFRHAFNCYRRAADFDVINDHSGPYTSTLAAAVDTPIAHTVHGPLHGRPGEIYRQIGEIVPQLGLISISENQRSPQPELPWLATVPNAIDLSLYPARPHRGEYLLFLGRLSADKGCHRAIAVAIELGLPLLIAGKKRDLAELEYFAEHIEPHLGHHGIEYLGEVPHGQKVELLQDARATLFPIEWEEPFGLVMIESMACGTPVIATRWGAVPEVIEDGVSGVIVDSYREMPAALELADALDPAQLRRSVEERFSQERMVADYVAAYQRALDRA
jgi:glycosyltransferase involved in cell wall biosynthesis